MPSAGRNRISAAIEGMQNFEEDSSAMVGRHRYEKRQSKKNLRNNQPRSRAILKEQKKCLHNKQEKLRKNIQAKKVTGEI